MRTVPALKQELIELMSEHKVSIKEVADILDRGIPTVKNWRAANEANQPPKNELRLLKFELEARKVRSTNEKTPATANS